MDIKNVIIFLVIFLVILWLQHNDDIKNNIKRTNLYDKINIPLVSSLLVIIIKELDYSKCEAFIKSFSVGKIPSNLIKNPTTNLLNMDNNIKVYGGFAPF